MSTVVANRYARALSEVLDRTGEYAPALKELDDFAAVWRESRQLREVLASPAIPNDQKRNVLDEILKRLGMSKTTSNFLRVLLAHYRIDILEEVVEAFRKAVNERLGIVEVEVSYAHDLSRDEQDALRARFGELTGKKVEIKFNRDDTLIGGVQARIGSTIYDGSISGQLERLREQLIAG